MFTVQLIIAFVFAYAKIRFPHDATHMIVIAELANREIENLHCVETLEEQILDLTDELETRKLREGEQARVHESEKQQIIDDIEGLRVGI